MAVLKVKNLIKSFDHRKVVNKVNLEIHSGEIIGLLGRNGAGKTTTFQMIVGLIKPDKGKIYLDNKDISRESTYLRANVGITYLPQENSVFLKASVENNLRLVLELQPYTHKEREKIIKDLLEELGLTPLTKQPAHSLSGGERRKLEICRALIIQPKFLLLDEPFTGIDPLTIVDLQKIMRYLKNKGIGIILSDHNVRDTFAVVNRAYVIDEGENVRLLEHIEGVPVLGIGEGDEVRSAVLRDLLFDGVRGDPLRAVAVRPVGDLVVADPEKRVVQLGRGELRGGERGRSPPALPERPRPLATWDPGDVRGVRVDGVGFREGDGP